MIEDYTNQSVQVGLDAYETLIGERVVYVPGDLT